MNTIEETDSIKTRIEQSLKEVKLIREGKLKGYTVKELLDEL